MHEYQKIRRRSSFSHLAQFVKGDQDGLLFKELDEPSRPTSRVPTATRKHASFPSLVIHPICDWLQQFSMNNLCGHHGNCKKRENNNHLVHLCSCLDL